MHAIPLHYPALSVRVLGHNDICKGCSIGNIEIQNSLNTEDEVHFNEFMEDN